jgi:hypothetical protein
MSILIQTCSAGSLSTSHNGFYPLDPFYISNVPDTYPKASMRCVNNSAAPWPLVTRTCCYPSSAIIEAVTFGNLGMFINPSRAAPISVKMGTPGPTGSIYALRANAQLNHVYAVFTSVLLISGSSLGVDSDLATFRGVSGLLCSQEWERFSAFFCMVFKERELAAQIRDNAISITTRAKPRDATGTGMFFPF